MYTTIIHGFRKELGISANDYMVVSRINMLSNKPEYPFCTEKIPVMADEIGIGEKTLRRSISDLIEAGLIEKGTGKFSGWRTLAKWYEGEAKWNPKKGNGQSDQLQESTNGQSDQLKRSKRPIETVIMTKSPIPPNKEENKKEEERMRVAFPLSGELRTQVVSILKSEKELEAFEDYWTEPSSTGIPRWKGQKFFDVARRARTWAARVPIQKGFPQKNLPPGEKLIHVQGMRDDVTRAELNEMLASERIRKEYDFDGRITYHVNTNSP